MSAQRKTRVAVFVSGGGTNLQALIDARDAGQLPDGEIALVVSNKKDAGALDRARRYDIPARYLRRKDFAEKLEPLMREFEIDMIVLAGFLCILPEEFTRLYPRRMINIHPALIPSFCGEGMYGLHVHEAALRRGVKVTGATVHFVNDFIIVALSGDEPSGQHAFLYELLCHIGLKGAEDIAGTEMNPLRIFHCIFKNCFTVKIRQFIAGLLPALSVQ